MPIFTVVHYDNSTKQIEAENKEILITNFSLADATAFQEQVKEIRWHEDDLFCSENISSGKITKKAKVVNEA